MVELIDFNKTGICCPPQRVTVGELGGNYGPDSGRKLVVSLDPGDVITVTLQGTRRSLSVTVDELYGYLIRRQVNVASREKARARRIKKAAYYARLRRQAQQTSEQLA